MIWCFYTIQWYKQSWINGFFCYRDIHWGYCILSEWEITFPVVTDWGDIRKTETANSGNKYGIQMTHVSGTSIIKGQVSHMLKCIQPQCLLKINNQWMTWTNYFFGGWNCIVMKTSLKQCSTTVPLHRLLQGLIQLTNSKLLLKHVHHDPWVTSRFCLYVAY
jgi:hypothetical protein